jgi:hypothetical protein
MNDIEFQLNNIPFDIVEHNGKYYWRNEQTEGALVDSPHLAQQDAMEWVREQAILDNERYEREREYYGKQRNHDKE